jgi:hypothetical protein
MLNNSNPLLSKTEWCRYRIHLTKLYLNHLEVTESMRFKVALSTSIAMASPPYKLSSKTLSVGSNLLGGYPDRLVN